MPPGCLAALVLLFMVVLVPVFFAQLMLTAVARLGLPHDVALLALFGIFLGGAINVPVSRLVREERVVADPLVFYGVGRLLPRLGIDPARLGWRRERTYTVIAVNIGGCVIPCILAVYEIFRVVVRGPFETVAMLAVVGLDVAVCWRLARPVPSVGIVMPALVPPLVAAIPAMLLVPDFAPPVAFVAGVLGPLIGADLLHLDEMKRVPTGVASIGGAGTFDGIVLSGMFAALLA